MKAELADFLHYCRIECRLADLTCSAYERDVRACMRFLRGEGLTAWQAVSPAHLGRPADDEYSIEELLQMAPTTASSRKRGAHRASPGTSG